MAVLPEGLVVPSLPYLVALGVLTASIVVFIVSLEPHIDQRLVFGFVPWMVVGASAHVFYQLPTTVYPSVFEPLAAAPAVYVTTFIAMGAAWVFLAFINTVRTGPDRVPLYLGAAGTGVLIALFGYAASKGALASAQPFWSVVALLVTIPVTIVLYVLLAFQFPSTVARTRLIGGLVVFAHTLDGISTTVGVDVLGRGERSPIPETIMEFAGQLPTAPYLGTGWLFVLVKIGVAMGLVVLFADYLEDEPVHANLLLAVIVAVGLGPAVNNLVLFALRSQVDVAGAVAV